MKRTLFTLALIAASAFSLMSTEAMAHGGWGSGGYGMRGGGYCMSGGYGMMRGGSPMMNYYQGDVYNSDNPAYQNFQKDTVGLRSDIAADTAELNALMAGTNPDPKRARALAESISAKQNQLAEAARKSNIQSYGNGWNCNGRGWYCNR